MNKFLKVLMGVLGVVMYALMFLVIVLVFEFFLYGTVMLGIVIYWASFDMHRLPTVAHTQTVTAMVFYLTMAVSVVLTTLAVMFDASSRKVRASLRSGTQPEESDQKSEVQES